MKRLSLLKLPADAQAAVSSGKLEIGQAQELVKVADDAKLVSKLVKKVTAPDGAGRSITIDVQAALTGREEAKAAAAKAKELTKAGETVVPLKLDYYNAEPPEGMKLVQPNGYSKHDLRFDVEKHRKLSCHAVGVHPKTAAVIEVCTAPGKHPDPAKQRQAEEEKRQQERAAEQERKQRERDHQIEFLTAAAVKPSKEIVLEAAYLALAGDGGYSYTDGELALALLGIEEPEEELVPSNPDENFDFVQEAVDKLAATPAGKLRVTFAYAADRLWGLGDLDHLLDHLGYEPPKGKAAKPKPEPEAKKPEKPEATEEVVDLMEALRRSVGSAEADQADVDAGEAEGEVVGEHTEDISHKH